MTKLNLWIALLFCSTVFAQEEVIEDYIHRYKDIAIEEMYRSGIPASIKLAQALLESDAGRSALASGSNNHFGMKCGPAWGDRGYYKYDDDYDRRGRLIKSCFRTYETPEESFIAHSEFLHNPAKAYRYAPLFEIDRRDYKSWAWGLKKAGYATNPRYANLLIKLIEKYHLYTFDYYERNDMVTQAVEELLEKEEIFEKPTLVSTLPEPVNYTLTSRNEILTFVKERKVIKNNGVKMVYAQNSDTPRKLAQEVGILTKDILIYNELITDPDQVLQKNSYVYLEKKKRKYRGDRKYHIVLKEESLYTIAQKYGIELEDLRIRNRLLPGMEPYPGEKLALRGMIKPKNRPKVRNLNVAELARGEIEIVESERQLTHLVQSGDTLYSIAQQYDISIDILKSHNSLPDNLIYPGQLLVVDK